MSFLTSDSPSETYKVPPDYYGCTALWILQRCLQANLSSGFLGPAVWAKLSGDGEAIFSRAPCSGRLAGLSTPDSFTRPLQVAPGKAGRRGQRQPTIEPSRLGLAAKRVGRNPTTQHQPQERASRLKEQDKEVPWVSAICVLQQYPTISKLVALR
jgi:hypothetical protein